MEKSDREPKPITILRDEVVFYINSCKIKMAKNILKKFEEERWKELTNSEKAELYFLKGYVLEIEGELSKAKECYRQALAFNPHHQEAELGLKRVYRIS